MKRIFCLLLLCAILIGLTACVQRMPSSSNPPSGTTAPAPSGSTAESTTSSEGNTTTTPPVLDDPFVDCDATGAKTLLKVTTVTYGQQLLAKEELQVNFLASSYTSTVTLRNDADADKPFSVETQTGTTAKVYGRFPLSTETVLGFVQTADGGRGIVEGETLAALLEIDTAPASQAEIRFATAEGHLVSLEIAYTAASGNAVTVVFRFSY